MLKQSDRGLALIEVIFALGLLAAASAACLKLESNSLSQAAAAARSFREHLTLLSWPVADLNSTNCSFHPAAGFWLTTCLKQSESGKDARFVSLSD